MTSLGLRLCWSILEYFLWNCSFGLVYSSFVNLSFQNINWVAQSSGSISKYGKEQCLWKHDTWLTSAFHTSYQGNLREIEVRLIVYDQRSCLWLWSQPRCRQNLEAVEKIRLRNPAMSPVIIVNWRDRLNNGISNTFNQFFSWWKKCFQVGLRQLFDVIVVWYAFISSFWHSR